MALKKSTNDSLRKIFIHSSHRHTNRNSISVIKSKFLSFSSMNTLLAVLKVTEARRDVILEADCTTDFLGDTFPPPPGYPFDDSRQIGNIKVLIWKWNSFNFESTIYLTLYINFDGQFEDGLSIPESLCTAAPFPQKKSEKGCLWGRGRLHTGQSQTDNPFLTIVWKRPITKIPVSSVLNDSKGLYRTTQSAVDLSVGLIILRGQCVSGHVVWASSPPKYLDWDCVGRRRTGTRHGNVYRSDRDKQKLLFISNVFYKQWHLCVSFH